MRVDNVLSLFRVSSMDGFPSIVSDGTAAKRSLLLQLWPLTSEGEIFDTRYSAGKKCRPADAARARRRLLGSWRKHSTWEAMRSHLLTVGFGRGSWNCFYQPRLGRKKAERSSWPRNRIQPVPLADVTWVRTWRVPSTSDRLSQEQTASAEEVQTQTIMTGGTGTQCCPDWDAEAGF